MSGPIPKPKKKTKAPMRQADVLFSKMIRERDGHCQAAGWDVVKCNGRLQCCHVVSRRYKSVRVDPENAIAMCAAHHVYYTTHPIEWDLLIEEMFPGRLAALRERALSYQKVNWRVEVGRLKGDPE
jgi:hypothetical protein